MTDSEKITKLRSALAGAAGALHGVAMSIAKDEPVRAERVRVVANQCLQTLEETSPPMSEAFQLAVEARSR